MGTEVDSHQIALHASNCPGRRSNSKLAVVPAIGRILAIARIASFVLLIHTHSDGATASQLPARMEDCTPPIASNRTVGVMSLPPLFFNGKPARAHTQGLEIIAGHYYVTARLEDPKPRRALLLRTSKTAKHWDIWDITPNGVNPSVGELVLDHPGGMQFDGRLLWVPIATSQRGGRSLLCGFDIKKLRTNRPVTPQIQYAVADHIGALAVSRKRNLVVGASWDTETVYVWNLKGHLERVLTPTELQAWQLGATSGANTRSGVAVQDWKYVGDRLYASGLYKSAERTTAVPRSRLLILSRFPRGNPETRIVPIQFHEGVELAAEGMAVLGDRIYFLPEDLKDSNRMFCVPIRNLPE
ncbi:MAG: hypothetical protein GX456_18925 [Verrucomicrobia bacterium]|nr:hypothetical protein [Verrucomicrobiota bacterium]